MAEEQEQTEEQEEILSLADDETLVDMARVVDQAFPNLKCLRCGNESFLLAGPVSYVFQSKTVSREHGLGYGKFDVEAFDLICQRCGMIERHSWKILQNAAKPIKAD